MKEKKRWTYRVLAAVLAVAMVFCMTGCMRIEETINVGADGSGSVQAKVLLYKNDTIELVKELSAVSGETMTDDKVTELLTQSGLTPVTQDGEEYFCSEKSENSTATRNFSSLKGFYDNGQEELGGLAGSLPVASLGLYRLESLKDDYVSLTETSLEASIPAMDVDTIESSLKYINGGKDVDVKSLEAVLKAYKKAKLLFMVSFATPVSKVSSNGTLSEDKKTVTFDVAACPDEAETLSAYCENDFSFDGIRSGMIYAKKVSYRIPDDLSAELNDTAVKGTVTSDKSGIYELKLKNEAGTQKTICYEVDAAAPVFPKIKAKGVYNKKGTLALKDDLSGLAKVTLDGADILSVLVPDYDSEGNVSYAYERKNLKDGRHTVTAEDKCGNKKSITFYIDGTAPVVKGVKNKKVYKKAVKIRVSDKQGLKSIKLNGKKIKTGKTVKKKGKYTLMAIDRAGNKTVVKFTVKK